MATATSVRWFPRSGKASARIERDRHSFDPADFRPALKTRLLILQPTPFCNINCDYCYLPNRDAKSRMSVDTVRLAAQRLLEDGLADKQLTVVWHAGEPLAMPVRFYAEAIAAVKEALPGCEVAHSIQTNATLIDDAWCELFKESNVRIGVSVDGPAALHDRHRRTRDGKGTHARVLNGMRLLREHGIAFHAIAVVTASTFSQADAFADFFLEQGVQEVGCNFDEAEGTHSVSSFAGNEGMHAAFLDRMLDRSIASAGRLRVREFANAYRLIAEGLPTYRWRNRTMPQNEQVIPFALISVAWNGDFCTFSPELLGQPSPQFGDFALGNVGKSAYFDCAGSEQFARMWNDILQGVVLCHSTCKHFGYCGGGAPANKLYEKGQFSSAETLYCRTMFKRPFDAVLARLERDSMQPNRPESFP